MSKRRINLIGVQIEFDGNADWADEFIRSLSIGEGSTSAERQRLVVRHADAISLAGTRELEPGVRVSPKKLVDMARGVTLERPRPDEIVLTSDRPAVEWLIWTLQLAVLQTGATFVHCAGVEREGQALLFPSWGGVGKTAIVAEFIRRHGWRLLGDDLVIVSNGGIAHAFHKPMVLYPYHRPLFPKAFGAGLGPVAPAFSTKALSHVAIAIKPVLRRIPSALAAARRYNPQSTRVRPADVFGEESMSSAGKISRVVWLDRVVGSKDVAAVRADEGILSRILGSTINEYDNRCVRLTNTAMGLGIIDYRSYLGAWMSVLEQATKDVDLNVLHVPSEMPLVEVPAAVNGALMDL